VVDWSLHEESVIDQSTFTASAAKPRASVSVDSRASAALTHPAKCTADEGCVRVSVTSRLERSAPCREKMTRQETMTKDCFMTDRTFSCNKTLSAIYNWRECHV